MSEESESPFQPHSDEELARLLEEQMRAMRSSAPITAPQPTIVAAVEETVSKVESEDELGIDALFGALLEDTTDIPVVQVEAEETVDFPSIDENSLEHTQPISYIHEDVVTVAEVDDLVVVEESITEVAVVDDHIVVEETVVEDVIEDAQVIAERVLSEISIDGEIVATTISETAGPDPIPQMFVDSPVSETIAAPIAAAPIAAASMSFTPEPVVIDEVIVAEEVIVNDIDNDEVVSGAVVDEPEVIEEFEAPVLRSTNPINNINTFAPRPTFDELVFGVKSED